jgi:putative ABC transport system substrate-binding protein
MSFEMFGNVVDHLCSWTRKRTSTILNIYRPRRRPIQSSLLWSSNGHNTLLVSQMRRRQFIGLIGGVATWPLAARGQQKAGYLTIGAVMSASANDEETRRTFESACSGFGWVEGRNIHIVYRWAESSQMRAVVAELVASAPALIVAYGTSVLNAVREVTNSIPVVFIGISDPEGVGIVANLARPGGNMTGLANFEPSMGGKWLQTLKEIAPHLTQVGVLRFTGTQVRILRNIEENAASSAMKIIDCPVRDGPEIRAAMNAFDGEPGTGLIVLPDPIFAGDILSLIFELAAKQRHPAIYPFRGYAQAGGLLSYGINLLDQVRRSAFYVDQILKGARPGDLPVQAPTKFELVINLRTARAMGLDVPQALLARADEVIE